jgi:hypothetical protein
MPNFKHNSDFPDALEQPQHTDDNRRELSI